VSNGARDKVDPEEERAREWPCAACGESEKTEIVLTLSIMSSWRVG